jgi:hypothetical protein
MLGKVGESSECDAKPKGDRSISWEQATGPQSFILFIFSFSSALLLSPFRSKLPTRHALHVKTMRRLLEGWDGNGSGGWRFGPNFVGDDGLVRSAPL